MKIAVTLRPDFLARHVCLVVRKAGYKSRRWTIYGRDSVLCLHPVTVDGEAAPVFGTRRETLAYLESLVAAGVEVDRIWAEPRQPRAYVLPATGRAVEVRATA